MEPIRATSLANDLIERGEQEGRLLTPMKLIKLVYMCHGWHLAIADEPLIQETVEAWKYGPVIRSVYRAFRGYGREPIDSTTSAPKLNLDSRSQDIVKSVWTSYGTMSGGRLSALTHQAGTPWHEISERYGGRIPEWGEPISNEAIKQHYKDLVRKMRSPAPNG